MFVNEVFDLMKFSWKVTRKPVLNLYRAEMTDCKGNIQVYRFEFVGCAMIYMNLRVWNPSLMNSPERDYRIEYICATTAWRQWNSHRQMFATTSRHMNETEGFMTARINFWQIYVSRSWSSFQIHRKLEIINFNCLLAPASGWRELFYRKVILIFRHFADFQF